MSVSDTAHALFSGGWRSQDAGELQTEYDLPDWEVRALVEELRELGLEHRLEADILDSGCAFAIVIQDRDCYSPESCWFFRDGGRAMDEAMRIWEDMPGSMQRYKTVCVRKISDEEFDDGVWTPRTGAVLWACGGKTLEGFHYP